MTVTSFVSGQCQLSMWTIVPDEHPALSAVYFGGSTVVFMMMLAIRSPITLFAFIEHFTEDLRHDEGTMLHGATSPHNLDFHGARG